MQKFTKGLVQITDLLQPPPHKSEKCLMSRLLNLGEVGQRDPKKHSQFFLKGKYPQLKDQMTLRIMTLKLNLEKKY